MTNGIKFLLITAFNHIQLLPSTQATDLAFHVYDKNRAANQRKKHFFSKTEIYEKEEKKSTKNKQEVECLFFVHLHKNHVHERNLLSFPISSHLPLTNFLLPLSYARFPPSLRSCSFPKLPLFIKTNSSHLLRVRRVFQWKNGKILCLSSKCSHLYVYASIITTQ